MVNMKVNGICLMESVLRKFKVRMHKNKKTVFLGVFRKVDLTAEKDAIL